MYNLENQMLDGKSRGKLDYSGLRKFTVQAIPDRFILFLLIWLYSIWASVKIQRFKIEITYSNNKHTE